MAGINDETLFGEDATLTGSGAGAQDVIQITPAAAIGGVAWKGIDIDGSALDPSASSATITGTHIDLSGVSLANDPIMDALHIQMPAAFTGAEEKHCVLLEGFGSTVKICDGDDEHAITTDGEIHVDFDASGLGVGEIVTVFDSIIEVGTATDGHVHALDISTGGSGSVEVIAVSTHPGVDVIHQHIGTSVAIDQGWIELGAGGFTDSTAAFNGAPDLAIFVNNSDLIYIGMTAAFDHIVVMLDTLASKDLRPIFEYSTGAGFSTFTPVDDTNGFQQEGSIFWNVSALAGFAARVVNASASLFYIRITRDRAGALTNPIEDTIQTLSATEFEWDKDGDIAVNSVLAGISNTGATNTITLQNPSDTGSSSSKSEISVGGVSAGDPWQQWTIGSTQSWSAGIDNSDSDKFKLTTDGDATVDPSSGTDIMIATVGGAISFPNASLTEHGVMIGGASGLLATTAVGNAAQVLTSNGAGNDPTFQDAGGGGSGSIVQKVVTAETAGTTCTVNIPVDNSIPQNTEGNEIMTVTITPTDASNIIELYFHSLLTEGGGVHTSVGAFFVDSTADAIHAETIGAAGDNKSNVSLYYREVAASTSARTYKLRVGASTGATYINSNAGAAVFGGVNHRYLIATEVKP